MKARSVFLAAFLAACLSVFLLVAFALGQSPGTISGAVVDERGSPVVQAQVRVDPLDGRPKGNAVRIAETDKHGLFVMNNLDLSTYKLFAIKESAGYPNTAAAFYSSNLFPTVTLTTTAPTANVTLKVGPPAGVVSGSISNAATGAPVPASFLLRRVSTDGWISMSQKATYRILMPPSTEVVVEVSAPGFKTWYYGGPSDALKRPPIRLGSGEEMRIDIQLQPEDRPEKQP